MEIAASMEEKKDLRDAIVTMGGLGITQNTAVKIYDNYGPRYIEILRTNPYKLADDIRGIGFKTADDIAAKEHVLEMEHFPEVIEQLVTGE